MANATSMNTTFTKDIDTEDPTKTRNHDDRSDIASSPKRIHFEEGIKTYDGNPKIEIYIALLKQIGRTEITLASICDTCVGVTSTDISLSFDKVFEEVKQLISNLQHRMELLHNARNVAIEHNYSLSLQKCEFRTELRALHSAHAPSADVHYKRNESI